MYCQASYSDTGYGYSIGTSTGVPKYMYWPSQHFWWYTTVGYCWTYLQGISFFFFNFLLYTLI